MQVFIGKTPDFTLADAVQYLSSFSSGGLGCLWLYHDNRTKLLIMINGCQVYPHFFPEGDHPGWQIAAPAGADWRTEVDFRIDGDEPKPMPLALVVSVERAVEVLKIYWEHGQPTEKERWTSLVAGEP